MKPNRIRVWGLVSLAVGSLGAAGLFLLTEENGGAAARGEHLPQFTTPPGMSSDTLKIWGMPNRELYTPLDSPRYVSSAEADAFLEDYDRVYLIRKRGATYVFPEVLLTSFHVVNDVIEEEPVAVTFCLLAGSACTFSRRVEDRVLSFGLTGQLYGGNSVLYDKETQTDWLQLNGEPLGGHYYGRARLGATPLERSTWRRIKTRQDLKVLAPIRGMEEYRRFQRDMETERLGQKVVESQTKLDPRLLPYTRGLGILVQGEARFYPEDPNGPRRLLQDHVGGWAVLVLRDGTNGPSRIFRRRIGERVLDFDVDGEAIVDRQTGSRWNDDGECIDGQLAGARLDVPSHTGAYWFVWAAIHPRTLVPSVVPAG
jgi:hypothetical protein